MKVSSRRRAHKFLGARKAERILLRLANIPDGPPVGTPVSSRTPHIASIADIQKYYPVIFEHCSEHDMSALRHLLRQSWMSSDLLRREWFVFLFRRFYAETVRRVESIREDAGKKLLLGWRTRKEQVDWILGQSGRSIELLSNFMDAEQVGAAYKEAPPPSTPFEECAYFLQRKLNRAQHCLNPACPSPYFFKTSRHQKYCSTDCSDEAKRRKKRDWWERNRGGGKKSKRRKSS